MTAEAEALKRAIDTLEPHYLRLWMDVCAMETPSEDKAALDTLVDFLGAFAAAKGYTVHRERFEKAGDCLRIDTPGGGSTAPLVLMAHMDTVHPKGAFGETPVTREGNTLRGPGVADCKGGIAAALLAMEALGAHRGGARPVRLVLTSDEELSGRLSGPGSIRFIEECARNARAVLNCEPGRPGELTVARKGIARLRLDIAGRAAHAGNAYFSGASAIREAAHKVLDIEGMSEPEGCTYNCGLIPGGDTANTVPGACSIQLDVRAFSESGLQTAVRRVEAVAAEADVSGASCRVTLLSLRPPMARTEANLSLFESINALAVQNGFPPFRAIERGGGSDAAYTTRMGVPTVCSCGPVGCGEHTASERAEIPSLGARALLLAGVAATL